MSTCLGTELISADDRLWGLCDYELYQRPRPPIPRNHDSVTMIHITANNGFSLPSGIHVGSIRSEVIGTYEEPDIHYGDGLYYKTDSGVNLVFHMRNGRVASMNLGWDA